MIKGLTYAIVTSNDLSRARRFYTEQLGLGTEDDIPDLFSQFTTREGAPWAIRALRENEPPVVELYLEVDDVDETYRLWQSRGVEMVNQPFDMPFGRTFAFKDCDGRVLHAWHPAA